MTNDADQNRRAHALRDLARQRQGDSAQDTSANDTAFRMQGDSSGRNAKRRRVAILAALGVALLLSSVIGWRYLQSKPQSSAISTDVVKLDLPAYAVFCPHTLAWSPNDRLLAIVASDAPCNLSGRALLAVFDVQRRKLIERLDANALAQQFSVQTEPGNPNAIGAPVWSHDSTVVACAVSTNADARTPMNLLMIPVNGAKPHLLSSQGFPSADVRTWDTSASSVNASGNEILPLALTYRWTDTGTMVTDRPSIFAAASGSYTGSPVQGISSPTFSRWQPGTLRPIPAAQADGSAIFGEPPSGWYEQVTITAWSPDKRYIVAGVTLINRVPMANSGVPVSPCLAKIYGDPCQQQPAALPDRAVEAVLRYAQEGTKSSDGVHTNWSAIPISWRPDGRILATILPDQYDHVQPSIVITPFFYCHRCERQNAYGGSHSDGF